MLTFFAFLFGCTLTYLITVLSSVIRSSALIEEALLVYAVMLSRSYELSTEQLEFFILNNKVPFDKAEDLRKSHKREFEKFANIKIKETNKFVPIAHQNVIRYKNYHQMNIYLTNYYKKQGVKHG